MGQGTRLGLNIDWLRWWDEAGNLLLWSSEQFELEEQRAEAAVAELESERQKKERFAAKLRELGVNPDSI
ncbi:hypothetical protein NIES4101_50880 [Calothrix sp. NIES-4101]|nr:hypothetical protein NIES4101_50880 [Calothrix sp. NIES-4101]